MISGPSPNEEEVFGRVEFSMSAGLVPWADPGEFVHPVKGRAFVLSDQDEEVAAGEIVLRLVSVTGAVNQGECLHDVCDADSSTLEAIYATLLDEHGEAKEELDIEPGWTNLLFVESLTILPEFRRTDLPVRLIDTAVALLCPDGLVVAVEESLDLTADEWRRLGFKRAADSPFVFRDQLRRNPYEPG